MEATHSNYVISDEPARLQPIAIHAYLSRSYWSENIPLSTVTKALEHSLCIGAYSEKAEQAGLIRVITDYATFAYLCDVYVLEAHRGNGLSKAMMAFALKHPKLQGLRSWNLRTRDAHGLYAQFGFTPVENPAAYMIRRNAGVYHTPIG